MKSAKKTITIFIILCLFLISQFNIFAASIQGKIVKPKDTNTDQTNTNETNTNQADTSQPNTNTGKTNPNQTPPKQSLPSVSQEEINLAVSELMALGIVNGKEDGQYHPEGNITREEFTKIIVEMLGFGEIISIVPKETSFSDVDPNSWSAQYINIAAAEKIINGYENNMFKPKDNVTLGQAVTIILRGLGYKDEYLSGDWPNNYILKAAEEGILQGINSKQDSIVNRGTVALMIYRALHIKPLEVNVVGGSYKRADKTLLEIKRGVEKLEDVLIMAKVKEDGEDAVNIKFTKKTYYDDKLYKADDVKIFKIKDSPELNLLVGANTTVFIDEDGYIFYEEKKSLENKIDENALVNVIIENDYDKKPVGKIRLSGNKEYFEIADDAEIYVDGRKIQEEDYERYLNDKVFGTYMINEEEITYAILNTWEFENLLVREIDINEKSLKCAYTTSEDEKNISLDRMEIGDNIYLIEGESKRKIGFSEILTGDIINITNEDEDTEEVSLYVWRNNVTGKFERLLGGINGQNISFTLQGNETEYEFADSFSYSYDGGEKIITAMDMYTAINRLSDFYNEQVTIAKNWRNDAVYLEGNLRIRLNQYGVVMYYYDSNEKIKIFTQTGGKTSYEFEDSSEYERLKETIPIGSIIKYSIGKSGKLKNFSDDIENDYIEVNKISTINAGDDFGSNYAMINGKKYEVDSNTVFFDYTIHDEDDVKKIAWNDLKDREVLDDVYVIFDEEDGKLKLLAIWENLDGIQAKVNGAYITSNYHLGNKRYVDVYSHGSPSKLRYELAEGEENRCFGGRMVLYKINTSSELETTEDDDYVFVSGEIEEIDRNRIKISDSYYYVYSEITEIYKGDKKVSVEDLDDNDLVVMYAQNRDEVKIMRVLDARKDEDDIAQGRLKGVDPDNEEALTIEVDGETRTFAVDDRIDYVFKDGYLSTSENQQTLTEALEERLGNEEPYVKFIYDKYTDVIYEMIIDMSVK